MYQQNNHAPLLIFAYGNPSRGDDALGPAMFDLLEEFKHENNALDEVDLLTDYQLQIEHAIDLERRKGVLFIDAGLSSSSPFEFNKLQAVKDDSYTSHAMSPSAVMAVYRKINQCEPPPSYMLTVRGYEFSLGQAITEQAKINLQQSYDFIKTLVETDVENWPEKVRST